MAKSEVVSQAAIGTLYINFNCGCHSSKLRDTHTNLCQQRAAPSQLPSQRLHCTLQIKLSRGPGAQTRSAVYCVSAQVLTALVINVYIYTHYAIFSAEIPFWLVIVDLVKGLGYSNSEVIGGLPRFI